LRRRPTSRGSGSTPCATGFASALIEDGRNIVQISRLLGHHSPSFTLSVYAHLMDDGVGGPLELDLTSSRDALDGAVEHVLRQEEV
jgi:integrase